MVQDSPSRKQDQFIVRLPDGMRDRIRVAAEANNRSMNAEIVATLSEKYPAPLSEFELLLRDLANDRGQTFSEMTAAERVKFRQDFLRFVGEYGPGYDEPD